MDINLKDYPNIIYREGNMAFTNNGCIVWGYKLNLPEIYSLAEKDFDLLHDTWYSALKDFDKGAILHKCDIYIKKPFEEYMPNETYLQKATKKHFTGRDWLDHHSFLFFTFRESNWLSESIINPFKKPVKTKDFLKSLEADNAFFATVERCVDFLNNSKYFSLEPIDEVIFQYLEHNYFNGFHEDIYTDIETDNLTIANKKVGVCAISDVRQLGETVKTCQYDTKMSAGDYIFHQGFADSLGLSLPCTHIFNQIIYFQDHKEIKSNIESQQRALLGARKFQKDYEIQAERLGDFLEEISDNEKIRLIGSHFNVTFFADSEKEYNAVEKLVVNQFKSMDIKPYVPNQHNRSNLFFNSFFANVANINKSNIIYPIDIQQSLCLLTNTTNYRNDDDGIFFNDRVFNIPVRKDVWDEGKKRIKARNFFIVAPTGEGKSVLANHIFRQYYENNIRIVIIDLGDSYRKLSLLYPEDTIYIKYQEGVSLGLNPFKVDDANSIQSAKVNDLALFVFKIWKRDRLPEEDEAVSLRKIITLYYQTVKENHSFPNFYEFISVNKEDIYKVLELNREFINLDDFLHITSEFTGDGIYSFLFASSSDESYKIEDKKFIIFELDEVKDNHVLLSIMLQMISIAVQSVVWKDRSTKGVIFFDEFAKMLKFPSVLSTAEYFYQAARKQEASIGIVLQSPSQLPKTEASNSIIDNTQVMYIMQNEKGYDEIISRFGLKEHDKNQLGSIKYNFTGKVKYSEFLLKIGSESNIVRLELAKEVLMAFATEGKDYTEIMALYDKHKSMEKAIEEYKTIK